MSSSSPLVHSPPSSPDTCHMSLAEFLESATRLEQEGLAAIAGADSPDALTAARNALIGRKNGRLTALMASLPSIQPEERRDAGAAVNRVKAALESALESATARMASS